MRQIFLTLERTRHPPLFYVIFGSVLELYVKAASFVILFFLKRWLQITKSDTIADFSTYSTRKLSIDNVGKVAVALSACHCRVVVVSYWLSGVGCRVLTVVPQVFHCGYPALPLKGTQD